MIHRQTQSSEYWSAYSFTPDDAEFLYGYVLEEGKPKRAAELARVIMLHRIEQESVTLRRQLSSEKFYQPKKSFQTGDEIIFPALKFATGQVLAERKGTNPDLGKFDVISVKLSDGTTHEFATNYARPHRLNDTDGGVVLDEEPLKTVDELYDLLGSQIVQVVSEALAKNSEFINIADEWFLRAMMTEVNVGHLNLTEAVLDVANGGPLTTEVILRDLGLPPDVTDNVQEASLNNVLASDDRFDEVSLNDLPAWFLRRLEPAEVREMPASLHATPFPGNVTLNENLIALAHDLDDELELDGDALVEPAERATLVLTFPHRRAGTLGWSRRVTAVLPQTNKPRIPLQFKDRVTGREMPVWLVRDGHYIWGLADWYRANDIPVGAYIELARGDAENVFWIDYRRRKPKREWVRVASSRDHRLHLETAQRAVACEVDELMSVFVDDPSSLDGIREGRPRDVAQSVRETFPEIAKFSPQGNVHASTLYSVANIVMRSTATDLFAALTANGAYVPVGDNYWHLGDR